MKTISLDLAKKLKEANFPQNSYFMWNNWHYGELEFGKGRENFQGEYRIIATPLYFDSENQFAAPTAEEILDLLPSYIDQGEITYVLTIKKYSNEDPYLFLGYVSDRGGYLDKDVFFNDKSLDNGLAKMWLYLKEKGLLASQS